MKLRVISALSAFLLSFTCLAQAQMSDGERKAAARAAYTRRHLPEADHQTVKGLRGCIAGQGELKKAGFDPLFALNHSAAMIRANVNRMFRRTWCRTQRRERLALHLALYAQYHNDVLLPREERRAAA